MLCPCCSGKEYVSCCKPYHEGLSPPTALSLMRSRYSAYALGKSDYIIKTTHPKSIYYENNRAHWKSSIEKFSRETKFIRLEIHDSGEKWVEFTAHLEQEGKLLSLKEKSHFQKIDGKWLYVYPK